MMYRLLEIASLAVYAFGALTFSTLVLFYWGERRRGKRRPYRLARLHAGLCRRFPVQPAFPDLHPAKRRSLARHRFPGDSQLGRQSLAPAHLRSEIGSAT